MIENGGQSFHKGLTIIGGVAPEVLSRYRNRKGENGLCFFVFFFAQCLCPQRWRFKFDLHSKRRKGIYSAKEMKAVSLHHVM